MSTRVGGNQPHRFDSPESIARLGTILGVWAHPDDETYAMGGIMAQAHKNKQRVICITATHGEAGVQDARRWPPEQLAAIRERELAQALRILGSPEHHWLDYADGSLVSAGMESAAEQVADIISTCNPDSILTFGPDGLTGHDDHKAVSRWTCRARELAGSSAEVFHVVQTPSQYESIRRADEALDIFFNIDKPDMSEDRDCAICLILNDDLYRIKLDALAAMPSQTEQMLSLPSEWLRPGIGAENFTRCRVCNTANGL